MTDRLDFETRLEERLRARAALASRPFDAALIARQAVAVYARRRRISTLAWPSTPPAFRWLVVGLLVAIALLGALAVAGALLRQVPVPPPGVFNSWVAYAQHSPLGSPDARNGPTDGYVVRAGTEPQKIASSDGELTRVVCPSFSPDGTQLAYAEATDTNGVSNNTYVWAARAVVVVTLDDAGSPTGAAVRIPVSPDGGDACPEWSFDGRNLAFLIGDPADLAIARADGSVIATPVGNAKALEYREFAWSPRGDVIATAGPSDIWLVPIDGGPARQFATGRYSSPRGLAWSPDASRIAYGTANGQDSSVRVLDLDGTTQDLGVGFGPAWSPDGDRIAYERVISLATSASEIVVANPDGSDPHVIAPGSLGPEAARPYTISGITWSPDGSRLQYVGAGDTSGGTLLISVSATGDPAPVVLVTGPPSISDTGLSWQSVYP